MVRWLVLNHMLVINSGGRTQSQAAWTPKSSVSVDVANDLSYQEAETERNGWREGMCRSPVLG